MYLLIAIQLTSQLMRHMPRKAWHAVHLTSFIAFIAATTHGALAGADRSNMLVQWSALSGTTWVIFLVVFRVLAPKRHGASSRIPASIRTESERLAAATAATGGG
jgi:hypothetical protein